MITLSPTPRKRGASTRIYDEERKTFYQSMEDNQLFKLPMTNNNPNRNVNTSMSNTHNDSGIKTPKQQFAEFQ